MNFIERLYLSLKRAKDKKVYLTLSPQAVSVLEGITKAHLSKHIKDEMLEFTALAKKYAKKNNIPYDIAYKKCWHICHRAEGDITTKIENKLFVPNSFVKKILDHAIDEGSSSVSTFKDTADIIKKENLRPTPLLLIKRFGLPKNKTALFIKWYEKNIR